MEPEISLPFLEEAVTKPCPEAVGVHSTP